MRKISNYQELLQEEERLNQEIETTKADFNWLIREALEPKNLFPFLVTNIKEYVWESPDEESFKVYIINLIVDYLFSFITEKLLVSKKEKKFDLRSMARKIAIQYYYKNETFIKAQITSFIDEQLSKYSFS